MILEFACCFVHDVAQRFLKPKAQRHYDTNLLNQECIISRQEEELKLAHLKADKA